MHCHQSGMFIMKLFWKEQTIGQFCKKYCRSYDIDCSFHLYIPVVRGRLRKHYNFNKIIWKTCCCIAAEKQIYYSMHGIAKGSMYVQYRPWQGLTLLIWWLLCGPLLSHGVRLSHHWWRVGARGCTREGRCGKGENDRKWNNDSDQKDWKRIITQIKTVVQ